MVAIVHDLSEYVPSVVLFNQSEVGAFKHSDSSLFQTLGIQPL